MDLSRSPEAGGDLPGAEAQTSGAAGAAEPGWWRGLLAPPVLAFQFLSAVPLPLAVPAQPSHLGRALALFPLVGAVLGLALAGLDAVLRLVLPVSVASILVVAAGTLLTGALHLDGLMDTCDGLFGGRTPARRLEIMRDSRVGSFGALAGAVQLLLKYAAITPLVAEVRGGTLVTSLVAGRLAMVWAIWLFPYARPAGLGVAFKAGLRLPAVVAATGLAVAAGWLALGWLGLGLVLVAGAAGGVLAARWIAGQLGGGLTGDTYGAVSELAEAGVLLGTLVWLGRVTGG